MKWVEYSLGDKIDLISGGTPSKRNDDYWNGDIPWVSTKDLIADRIYDTQDHVTQLGLENGTRCIPPETILISVRGMRLANELPISMVMCDATFNQDLKAVIPDDDVNNRFLYYWFKGNAYEIRSLADEAAHGTKRIQTDRLLNFPLYLPPLQTQHRIANIFSAYDDLIENNTRRIRLLEQAARDLYREWFVEFRFPGHEDVPLVESEMGQIPRGWEVNKLEEAFILQRGFDLPTRKRIEGDYPVFAATSIVGTHNEAKVEAPGIVTGRSGSLGTVTYVDVDFWPLNTTLWVREFRRATPLFAYYLLDSMDLEAFNSGSAVPSLNRNFVHAAKIVLPTADILSKFDDYVLPMYEQMSTLRRRNHVVRKTRDLLLPRLVSGELDVNEVIGDR